MVAVSTRTRGTYPTAAARMDEGGGRLPIRNEAQHKQGASRGTSEAAVFGRDKDCADASGERRETQNKNRRKRRVCVIVYNFACRNSDWKQRGRATTGPTSQLYIPRKPKANTQPEQPHRQRTPSPTPTPTTTPKHEITGCPAGLRTIRTFNNQHFTSTPDTKTKARRAKLASASASLPERCPPRRQSPLTAAPCRTAPRT